MKSLRISCQLFLYHTTGHYEKTISVYAESSEQAAEKVQIVLFDTDLIDFSDEDFAYGEADIKEADEDGREEHPAEDEDVEDDCCSGCPYFCSVCGECVYENECEE